MGRRCYQIRRNSAEGRWYQGSALGPAGDKIADEFANGEDGFIKVRDTIVGIAKNDLKPALDDVGSELTKSADAYVRQTNSIREH